MYWGSIGGWVRIGALFLAVILGAATLVAAPARADGDSPADEIGATALVPPADSNGDVGDMGDDSHGVAGDPAEDVIPDAESDAGDEGDGVEGTPSVEQEHEQAQDAATGDAPESLVAAPDSAAPTASRDDPEAVDSVTDETAHAAVRESATLTGRIVDAHTGAPVVGAAVTAAPTATDVPWAAGSGVTGSDGRYTFAVSGEFPTAVALSFESPAQATDAPWGYAPEWWNDARRADEATLLPIAANDVLSADAALEPRGAVTGLVSEWDDAELSAVEGGIVVLIDDESGERIETRTDGTGAYEVAAPAGRYTVGFRDASQTLAEPEWRQFYRLAAHIEDATPVTVESGEASSGIDAVYGAAPEVDHVTAGQARIVGTAVLGEELSADPGSWYPAGVALSYQWYRGDAPITGATAAEYVPVVADLAFALSVRVVGTKPGLTPASAVSAPSGVVVDSEPGSLAFTVHDEEYDVSGRSEFPVADVRIVAALQGGSGFTAEATTNARGTVVMPALPRGDYVVTAYAADESRYVALVRIEPGARTTYLFLLSTGLPAGMEILGSWPTFRGGVSVARGEEFQILVHEAPDAVSATWVVTGPSGRSGRLEESPAGTYGARVVPGLSVAGTYTLTTRFVFADGSVVEKSTRIYIDPSGSVVDRYGTPVAYATVTIARADAATGPFVDLPDGSPALSPRNRTNPDTTGVDGSFGWDVVPGWYTVTASQGGASATTAALEVPPERLGLLVGLDLGDEPAAMRAPAVTGSPTVGEMLHVSPGLWPAPAGQPAPITVRGYQWTRDGVPISGATSADYAPTAADAGSELGVVLTMGREYAVAAGTGPQTWTVAVTADAGGAADESNADPGASVTVTPPHGGTPASVPTGELPATGAGELTVPAVLGGVLLVLAVAMLVSTRLSRRSRAR